jgi:lysosomal alpha-mannosidase
MILNSSIFVVFLCVKAKIETRALKAKRPGFTDERYSETEYFFENGKSPFLSLFFLHPSFDVL